jgi:hypothetical protein
MDDKVVFLTQDLRLITAGSVFQSKSMFIPKTVYNMGDDKILVNQNFSSHILNLKDGADEVISQNIFALTPLNSRYYFLQKRGSGYSIKKSSDLEFGDAKTIVDVNLEQLGNPDEVEIRILGGVPYFITTKVNTNNLRDITVYGFMDGKVDKKDNFSDIFSIQYGQTQILYSVSEQKEGGNFVILTNAADFTNREKITNELFNIGQNKLGVKGDVVASRCDISTVTTKIVCMIKQDETPYWNADQKDVFVEYNKANGQSRVLYEGLNISAHSVVYSPNDEIYIFGQENNLIYGVK